MYVGAIPTTGDFKLLDSITTSSATTFNLRQGGVAVFPQSANHCIVQLNGVNQVPTSSFNIVNDTIVFSEALTSSDVINQILVLGNVNDIGVPSDDTVSSSKIQTDAINATKIADDSISDEHLDITAITGQTAITSLADTDKFLVSDASDSGNLKYVEKQYLPSGALVSLGSSDSTTNTPNVVFDNVFSDTYSRYIIYIDTIMPVNDGEHLYFKFRKSDGSGGYEDETRTGYVYHVRHIRNNSTSDYNLGANSGGATTHGTLTGSVKNSTGEHGVKAVINVYRPSTRQSQATMTYLTCDGTYRSHANDDSMSVILSTAANNYHTDAMLGIKFYFSGGNVDDHKITVYGVTT